jgi:hypothetical protein
VESAAPLVGATLELLAANSVQHIFREQSADQIPDGKKSHSSPTSMHHASRGLFHDAKPRLEPASTSY